MTDPDKKRTRLPDIQWKPIDKTYIGLGDGIFVNIERNPILDDLVWKKAGKETNTLAPHRCFPDPDGCENCKTLAHDITIYGVCCQREDGTRVSPEDFGYRSDIKLTK